MAGGDIYHNPELPFKENDVFEIIVADTSGWYTVCPPLSVVCVRVYVCVCVCVCVCVWVA